MAGGARNWVNSTCPNGFMSSFFLGGWPAGGELLLPRKREGEKMCQDIFKKLENKQKKSTRRGRLSQQPVKSNGK